MPADAERDPVEWAQHSALVAISVARTVLDLAEAAVTNRERLERFATSGRSFAETWLGDAVRLANSVASGFGFEAATSQPPPPPPARSSPPARPPAEPSARRPTASKAAKRPAKAATTRPAAKPKPPAKKSAKGRKTSRPRPKPRKR